MLYFRGKHPSMKLSFVFTLCLFLSLASFGQTIDAEAFKADIKALYESANQDFKGHIQGEGTDEGEHTKYTTNLVLNGASEAYITEDEETSRAYVAHFILKNVRNPQEKLDEVVKMVAEVCEAYGLAVNSASSIKYVGYTMKTLEYPSDNIDEMGRYPTFSIGLLKEGNPMEFEIIINEPFWK